MLGCYYKHKDTYFNDEKIRTDSWLVIIDEKESSVEETEVVTWANVEKFSGYYGFYSQNKKKGKVIHFNLWNRYIKPLKQWKNDTTRLSLKTYYTKAGNVSINQILDYSKNELAIQYLVEKGINIFNKS